MAFPKAIISSGNAACIIPEEEQIIGLLERGTVVNKFYHRKRMEKKTLMLRRETRQVIWSRSNTNPKAFEGYVNLYEVKEIRPGKCSKDFEKWPEDSKRLDSTKCFVVVYGNEFKLKFLSIAAWSERECENWIRGLKYMVADTVNAPYPLLVERWLRREFYTMENAREKVTLKEVRSFLPKVNCKIATKRLGDVFQEVDTRHRQELGFDDFTTLYYKLMFGDESASFRSDVFKKYSADQVMSLQDFQSFMDKEQKDAMGNDERLVSKFMRDYLQDPTRDVQEPYFTENEFMDFLYSKQNDLWDTAFSPVYQDMSRPLSHYWISSSHNTYLTGDQFSSESSLETYARCLRMGCRCIELDCWDGPDDMPFIYHGHTLTSKIKFLDVIKTIREHAFVTSEYPVILSIEDNCSLPQQRNMARAFQEVFGDMLLTQPVDKNETFLPSPFKMRRKIILKHKKLKEGEFCVRDDEVRDMDLRNTVKNGILYLQDNADRQWYPHFFVLTQNSLIYTDSCNQDQQQDAEEEEEPEFENPNLGARDGNNDELHFSEKWFHGRLADGRKEAEDLLKTYSHLGDGTFLVRNSHIFVGDYSLSFWRQGKVYHCHIKTKQERGQTRYYLHDTVGFDSLYSLITYYKNNALRSQEFLITLREPVPQPSKHEGMPWFARRCNKLRAENLLRRVPNDGAFLVRPSDQEANSFTISFRAEKKIKHCRIKVDGRLYTIGSAQFESLVELVSFYERTPLYRKVKLLQPVNESLVMSMGNVALTDEDDTGASAGYTDPSVFTSSVTVKAKYDYQAQMTDELSFPKGAIIQNVTKDSSGWWRGDYGGRLQHMFPSNYVVEVDSNSSSSSTATGEDQNETSDSMLLGNLQKGAINLTGVVVELENSAGLAGHEWQLKITNSKMTMPFVVAAPTREVALEWGTSIRDTAASANDRDIRQREQERSMRVAVEISSLIIYCKSVAFDKEKCRNGFDFTEMSSFPENKAEKTMCSNELKFFLKYHIHQISRVYPKGQRLDSSNYNPVPMWNVGSQMVALNFQTGDKFMQLNQAKFRLNGNCGYLLKPEFMMKEDFDPYEKACMADNTFMQITLRVIGARHLCRQKKGIISPFVEVEVIGLDYDSGVKLKTKTISDNGFNPVWNETTLFEVVCPQLAFLRFVVYDEDVFGDSNFVCHGTYSIMAIRTGYRSIALKNNFSEDLELSSLLVHIEIKNYRVQELENTNIRGIANAINITMNGTSTMGDFTDFSSSRA
ncbi:1-phosphatidylinositol 4,5-bisphosphate phosphodiesterase gamma-1 [Neocloeon triangulifer]|uniref:1-phosphatidylinositol 4,5-bisphosphate phosphodiesterase gamma-1 n=1 Tax=Neocloeon triangulifer TaxID=2078957 RepID=UPI00286F018B|nr:1-phosphatidylinositol 4,5-bisphosphate phosphodiesterase gamma-1 [Neocloeon triangulifer]